MAIVTEVAKNRPKTAGEAFDLLLQRTARRVAGGTRSPATLAMQREHVRYLLERLPAETPLADVTTDRILEVLELEAVGRGGRELSGGTLRKRAYTLRQTIELATGHAPELPEIAYVYRPRTAMLQNFDDYARLRDALQPSHRLWFVVATWTGQRHADVEGMKVEDFNPKEEWVVVRSSKTRKFSGVRIHAAPELVRELTPHWELLGAGDKLVPRWPQPNSTLRWHCDKLGLPRISTHGLRHTFFTWYVAANGFTPELLEIGGWNDLRIPARVYAHALPVRFRGQIERTVAMATSLRRGPRNISSRRTSPVKGIGTDGVGSTVGPVTRPEGLAHGTGLDARPPATSKQRRDGEVPRDRVELSTHGFSVLPCDPIASSPEVETPSEGRWPRAPIQPPPMT